LFGDPVLLRTEFERQEGIDVRAFPSVNAAYPESDTLHAEPKRLEGFWANGRPAVRKNFAQRRADGHGLAHARGRGRGRGQIEVVGFWPIFISIFQPQHAVPTRIEQAQCS